jgi:Ca2+-binding RTX toxin-like protein
MNTITGTIQNDRILTTIEDDLVNALDGNDFIKGSQGNDTIDGGTGTDTMSYDGNIGDRRQPLIDIPIRLNINGSVKSLGFIVEKEEVGFDELIGIETIEASENRSDFIDVSGTTGTTYVEIDLGRNKMRLSTFDNPDTISQDFTVRNFEHVIGTQNADIITGDISNNIIDGGNGDDILDGVGVGVLSPGGAAPYYGQGSIDTLTGGGGNDKFILAKNNISYYNGDGNNGYANINEFKSSEDTIYLAAGVYGVATGDPSKSQLYALNMTSTGLPTYDLIANINYKQKNDIRYPVFEESIQMSVRNASSGLPASINTFSLSEGQSFGIFTSTEI